ncbi:MAG: phosphoribosylformylglycinamidine cyclo-ligase [Kiritimatiellia bacterium]
MKKKNVSAYAAAGVNIDEKMAGINAIKKMVKTTATPGVLTGIGSFGGMFRSPGKGQILVASTDGVGTKLKIATLANRHDTVGQDIVNHCVNDILVQGARPLFFMDYIGTSKVDRHVMAALVKGMCAACRQNDCALLGGETAEMPGVYPPGEYDLVGTIVGVVDKRAVITGGTIRPGDVILGLPSSGLHTNGYSLARKIVFETAGLKVGDRFPGTKESVADVLLAVHRSYLKPVSTLLKKVSIRGLAHITGGGFPDNVPRILPEGVTAVFDRSAWKIPPLFSFLQEKGDVNREEMYRVFNMGIGMVVIVREADAAQALAVLKAARARPIRIGRIAKGRVPVLLEN